ncbi:MAG TPA: hypothetical protein VEA80_01715 [Vitreimonas sp.]|uniref:hypothetical protein n=1 Tax=Vitreimonas sp. TaxID=3069702 RepID=UPI002D21EFEE|nr:hypothetical protein [Vitreimonas sp.]HYD86167.1 hypothetical protein [Vitreimonas sp.]
MRTRLTAFAAALFLAPLAHAQTSQPPPPTCEAAEHRQLDFWIGEWDAFRSDTNAQVGRSSVTREEAGCVIHEHWTAANGGVTGQSFNIFERMSGQWEQYWVSSNGEITHYIGGPIENGLQLTAVGDRSAIAPGAVFQSRVTLTAQPDGTVRQVGETSGDGQTWTRRYDITYRRRPE